MLRPAATPSRLRFGSFQADLHARTLWAGGKRVRMQQQVFELLVCLLERPGELVDREELRARLWPDGTFVDFEHGLNTAVRKLRRLLGDSAESPRYVDTVVGRGYRFLERVEALAPVASHAGEEPAASALLPRMPFVGRKAELGALATRLAKAREGRGGLVLVVGEPGIGKTRLLEEFADRARREGVRVIATRCEEAGEPHQPFAEALSGSLRDAAQSPLVLVLDDLHQADPRALDAVAQLVRAAVRSMLLVVASCTPATLKPAHPLARLAARKGLRESILLRGLEAEELHRWLEAVGPGRIAATSARTLRRATGGSPRLVRDLLLEGGGAGLERLLAGSLPIWHTPLVGRDRERQEVVELFVEERLVTLVGAGGCGKTRLAHAAAEDLLDRFADGVAWVELATLGAREQVAGAVVAACGARETPGASALGVLARHLARSERLLVLDNCEHVRASCAELADALLRAAPGVRILATSREPLGVAGERAWRVPSLSLPDADEHTLGRIAESDAVSLFRARARVAQADFRLDAAAAPVVARICRQLDGIPLALELAAAQVRSLSLQGLAEGLDDRFRLLAGSAQTRLPRQRTLLASVEWSHDLLEEPERVLLRRLSVFAAPFDLDAAEALAADANLDALGRLVDKSLVQDEGDRYRLLETIRHYALERAKDAGELDELRGRHLAWFERSARAWGLDREIASPDLLEEIASQAPDLIAAAEWCAARGRPPTQILHALRDHWGSSDGFQAARAVSARVLGSLPVGSAEWLEATAAIASILVWAGDYSWLGPAREALEATGTMLDSATRGFLEAATSLPEAFCGRSEAIAVLRRVAGASEREGHRRLERFTKESLVLVSSATGDLVGARTLLASLAEEGPLSDRRYSLRDRARLLTVTHGGDLAGARRLVEEAFAGGHADTAFHGAGTLAFYSADVELLRRVVHQAEHFRGVGGPFSGVPDLMDGFLLLVTDELEAAERALARAAEQLLYGSTAISVAALRGRIRLALGDVAGAEAHVATCEAQLAGSELHHARAITQLLTAQLDRVRGERLAAESRARAALASASKYSMSLVAIDALEVLALLAGDRGDLAEAARLSGAAHAFRAQSGYRWQAHHHRRELAALRSKLDEQALAEGAALSLDEAAEHALRGHCEQGSRTSAAIMQ